MGTRSWLSLVISPIATVTLELWPFNCQNLTKLAISSLTCIICGSLILRFSMYIHVDILQTWSLVFKNENLLITVTTTLVSKLKLVHKRLIRYVTR
jgi:hypothetical protein